ncbi:hypothetical protein [Qingshengfaniella alkalisoli]|uniref:Uncharacterized protein n=1 Tax=Qingshengfaniella alkalisoli TaxID=2599296 RepID=A0A5B8J6E9_9RHOB|nr:hypothetical protein [Qingshengfaniella alkalisoli]QDY69920.1 hypothetical protein FPZ52_10020 [Qingshengfaniella alkalisoli]
MFTWISKHRLCFTAFGLIPLAACAPQAEVTGRAIYHRAPTPVVAINVSDNAVVIVGPDGYCIDDRSTRDDPEGTLILLGSCAALTGAETAVPELPALLTALVSPRSDIIQRPTTVQLEEFFRSDEGLSALSYGGDPTKVDLLSVTTRGDALVLSIADSSEERPAELTDTFWRAVLPVRDRLVVLTVNPIQGSSMSDGDAFDTLRDFIGKTRAANPPQTD